MSVQWLWQEGGPQGLCPQGQAGGTQSSTNSPAHSGGWGGHSAPGTSNFCGCQKCLFVSFWVQISFGEVPGVMGSLCSR